MANRFDDGLFLEMEKETKQKLRELASKSERSMSAWVRNQIHREHSKLVDPVAEPAQAG